MKHLYTALFSVALLGASCSEHNELTTADTAPRHALQRTQRTVAGKVRIKLASTILARLPQAHSTLSLQNAPTALAQAFRGLKAYRLERVFPVGKYEARTRAAGLDRWYTLYFDEQTAVKGAISTLSALNDVETVEAVYPLTLPGKVRPVQLNALTPTTAQFTGTQFNDAELSKQWHYYNDGSQFSSRKGADINVLPVWEKYTTGTPNVVVAVVDGGIDVTHEDLKDNLYVNLAEKNGQAGVDDDGNGFVDDVYGYNFVKGKDIVGGTIVPDVGGHGTHVAGTVAARNNNGIGVCGVAGGNGNPNSGARLMSCQIYLNNDEQGEPAEAIKYAADNGAVICQNSWGYDKATNITEMPALLQEAIDYFIEYAGCDERGEQLPTSPMKGGVVIFAAGNENSEHNAIPASYPPIVSVAASGWDLSKTTYSNYGTWVSICAPGGDQTRFKKDASSILSTYPQVNGGVGYGYSDGTSMACPQVSGVAALIASYFGKQGFTNHQLKLRLSSALLPENPDEINAGYAGKIGRGYLNAEAAFAENQKKAPQAAPDLRSTADYTSIELTWGIAADEDDGTAQFYHLYLSDTPLTTANLREHQALRINGLGHALGERLKKVFANLRDNTTYYIAIVAEDRWGYKSAPSFTQVQTLRNTPPVATPHNITAFDVSNEQSHNFVLNVNDAEGHEWTASLKGTTQGVSLKQDKQQVRITVRSVLGAGTYDTQVVLTDELGASSEVPFRFTVREYRAPQLITALPSLIVGQNTANNSLNLAEYYNFSQGEKARFTLSNSNPKVLNAQLTDDGLLTLKALQEGLTQISITASDGRNSNHEGKLQVRVVKDANAAVYALYPIPVRTDIHALLNTAVQQATFVVSNSTGEEIMRQELRANAQNVATMSLKNLPPGTYRMSVITPIGTHVQSFLKR